MLEAGFWHELLKFCAFSRISDFGAWRFWGLGENAPNCLVFSTCAPSWLHKAAWVAPILEGAGDLVSRL